MPDADNTIEHRRAIVADARALVGEVCERIADRTTGPTHELAREIAASHMAVAQETRAGAMTTRLEYALPAAAVALGAFESLAGELFDELSGLRAEHSGMLLMEHATNDEIEAVELAHTFAWALALALARTAESLRG